MLLGVGEPFKGKFKGKPGQGLVAWTLCPPLQMTSLLATWDRSVQEMRGARRTEQASWLPWETTPGAATASGARSVLKEASRAPGTYCRQPGAVIPVRGSRAADDSGDRVTLGGFSSWPSRISAVATEPTPKPALGKVRKQG